MYRNAVREDLAVVTGSMHKNVVKIGRVLFELCERTDIHEQTNRQIDRHTHHSRTAHLSRGKVIITTSPAEGVQSIVTSMPVCLSVGLPRSRNTKTTRFNFAKYFSARCLCRRSVLFWQSCGTLCTSGFVNDIMFTHNGRVVRHVNF